MTLQEIIKTGILLDSLCTTSIALLNAVHSVYFYRLCSQKLVKMSHLHSTRLAYLEGDQAKGEVVK